ncbi:MAG: GNAT family N-acetyltransferase [Streptosporangiaceae bacterium]
MMTVTRILSVDDAEEMLAVLSANREFLGNSGPQRTEDFFTVQAQRADLERALEAHAREVMVPLAILDEQGQIIGRININNITRGAAQSATVGYWVSQSHNGQGFASAALTDVIDIAFKELRLHRLQADTRLENTASQRVLTRNGFHPFAIAPSYLKIAGRWQDVVMYHLINPDEQ